MARFTESEGAINELFLATIESLEEAIWNSVIAAETMTGRDGNTLHALPHDQVLRWFKHYRTAAVILEAAVLNVKPGQTSDFEAAFAQAAPIIASMPGCIRHELAALPRSTGTLSAVGLVGDAGRSHRRLSRIAAVSAVAGAAAPLLRAIPDGRALRQGLSGEQ